MRSANKIVAEHTIYHHALDLGFGGGYSLSGYRSRKF